MTEIFMDDGGRGGRSAPPYHGLAAGARAEKISRRPERSAAKSVDASARLAPRLKRGFLVHVYVARERFIDWASAAAAKKPPTASTRESSITRASASFCWLVEHFPYATRELIERERFLKQPHSRIKATMVDDGVARIARREQDLQTGPRDRRLLSKHPSGPAGQDNVGEQEVYAVIRPQNR
jgi:hypothetical protein